MNYPKNKMSLDDICDVIGSHVYNEKAIMFVCDYSLASAIVDYVEDTYGDCIDMLDMFDDNIELDEEIDEYYVTIDFDRVKSKNQMLFFCEKARGTSGRYKMSDIDNIDYFIFTDMSDENVNAYLLGYGTRLRCELVEDEEEYCETEEMIDCFVEDLENLMCPHCIKEKLIELYRIAFMDGMNSAKLGMIEDLQESME
jgi:hypothetical protein